VTVATRPLYIGGEPDSGTSGSNWLSGNLAEVVAVKGSVTDARLAELDQYFKTKFALP
jgi:hypothetical protein